MVEANDADTTTAPSTTEHSVDMREFGAMGTGKGSTRMASMSTIDTNQSDVRHHNSIGRLSSMFRQDRGTMSTIKGKSPVRSIYEASMITDNSRHSHEHVHDVDEDGLENVRACCGGMSFTMELTTRQTRCRDIDKERQTHP
jgi:hypothetical protein